MEIKVRSTLGGHQQVDLYIDNTSVNVGFLSREQSMELASHLKSVVDLLEERDK